MTIRTLIVDDEPLAREKIRSLLEREPDFTVIAECEDGQEAARAIAEQSPDALFLDIRMPKLDGLGLIETVGAENMPATVIVSAYQEYALKAFDLPAVDYLVKPVDGKRFRNALKQIRLRVQPSEQTELKKRLDTLLEDFKAQESYVDRLVVKSSGRFMFLDVAGIDWIDAAGNYVRVNAQGKRYMMRQRISAIERKLDPKKFLRIHRSTIVNTHSIREIRPLQHGECLVFLDSGQRLSLSRSYRDNLSSLLG